MLPIRPVKPAAWLAFVALLGAAACERTPNPVPVDSVVTTVPEVAKDSLRPPVGTGWEADAGPFVILPTVDGGVDAGSLLRPDATELTVGDTTGLFAGAISAGGKPALLELFSRGALLGESPFTVEITPGLEAGCTAWPIARLHMPQPVPSAGAQGASSSPARAWTAAFVKGLITQLPLDSIEGLSPRDSSLLAVNIARLASGLRDDTVATFRGLPFVVLRAYRANLGTQSFIVATLVRRVNQEDAPMEERLVMIVDGNLDTPKEWTVGWHERASGREDELVVSEPLVAFTLGTGKRSHLLFGRDDGVALSAAMLVREVSGWKVLWESALAGCDR